jgi:CBS domain containing-hemolysin-like protein
MSMRQRIFFRTTKEHIRSEIASLLGKAQKYGLIDKSSKEMIENILNFSHLLVREIMIPRTEIIAVSAEATIEGIIKEVVESRHTRIPVYRGTIDNIIGILNVKDLLDIWTQPITAEDILNILTKPFYIPETKSTHLLFYELKENKKHIAIVIDEYGGTSGLVTLEDLLEEIVGEIRDEHESIPDADGIFQAQDGSWLVEGRTEIEKLDEYLNIILEKGRYETIGGLILNTIKRIPLTGEKFTIQGLEMSIENADERTIKKVRIRNIKETPNE